MKVRPSIAAGWTGLILVAASSLMAQSGSQEARSFSTSVPKSLQYLLYLPDAYETKPAQSWPLLVFLHGSGERGDDLELLKKHGPPKLIAEGRSFPFLVASPQCPANQWWDPGAVQALVESIRAEYRVDPARIYLTGMSMGGFGTWSTASFYPETFAAIAPVCGGGIDLHASRTLAEMPVWCFHGGRDPVVALEQSERMVHALRAKGNARVRFTIYPEAGHDSWTRTYADDRLYTWLLSHRKMLPSTTNP